MIDAQNQLDSAYLVGRKMREAVLDKSLSLNEIKHDIGRVMAKPEAEPIPLFDYTFPGQDLMVRALEKSLTSGRYLKSRDAYATKDVLNTAGGTQSPLIRTDIVPHLTNLFVDKNPLFDAIQKVPANGLSETWDVVTDPGFSGANFVDDLGAASPSISAISQMQTLVAIGLAERGSTWRMRFAQQQSGMSYDGKDATGIELENGTTALARLFQTASFQGETKTAGKTGTDEFGTYYQFGFDGLRGITGGVLSNNASYFPGSTQPIGQDQGTQSLRQATEAIGQAISDAGGDLQDYECWMPYGAYAKFSDELGNLMRVNPGDRANYGVAIENLVVGGMNIPVRLVPGNSIGSYVPATGAYAGTAGCYDAYFINPKQCYMAHLGPAAPFVIQIPTGVDGTLTDRYLIGLMTSLIVTAPSLQAKLRVGK